jgi:PAS domain-containing protein
MNPCCKKQGFFCVIVNMPLFVVENLELVGKLAGSLTAIGGFFFVSHKYLIKKIINHFKEVLSLHGKIDEIYKEVKPNGGSSIKDIVNRLEKTVLSVDKKVSILQETEDAFREDGPLGVFECSVDGENKYVNRTFAKWLGVSKSDLMGFGWRNYLESFSTREDYDQEWQEAFKQGREVKLPVVFRGLNDTKVFCFVQSYPIFDSEGVIEKYLGIIHKEKDEG